MKTTIIRLFIIPLLLITLLISCNTDDDVTQPEIGMEDEMDDDDDDNNDDDTANLNLTFTLHTQQDQIGDFAFNEMAAFNGNVHSYYGAGLTATTEMPYNLGVWHSENGIAWVSDASFASERRGHSVTEFNGDLFLIGGADNDDNDLEEVWVSNDGFNWTLGSDFLPFGSVSFHSTVAFNDQLY